MGESDGIQVGDRVCAKGIKAKPELNGVQGVVVKIMDERIGVDFGNAIGMKSLKRDNLQYIGKPSPVVTDDVRVIKDSEPPIIVTPESEGLPKKKNKKKKKKKDASQHLINTPDTAISSTPPTPALGPFSIGRPRDEIPVPSVESSSPKSTPLVSPNPSPNVLSPMIGPPGTPSTGPRSPAISAMTPPRKFRCSVPVVCDTVHSELPGGMIREDSILDKSRHVAFNEEKDVALYDPSNKETPEEKEALRKQMRAAKQKEEELAKKRKGAVAVVEDEVSVRKLLIKEEQKKRKALKSVQRNEEVEIEINSDARTLEGSIDICSDENLARSTVEFEQKQQFDEIKNIYEETPLPVTATALPEEVSQSQVQFSNPGDIFLNFTKTPTPDDSEPTSLSQDQIIADLRSQLAEQTTRAELLEATSLKKRSDSTHPDMVSLQQSVSEQISINEKLTTKITTLEASEKDHSEALEQLHKTRKELTAQTDGNSNAQVKQLTKENEKLKNQMEKGFSAMQQVEEENVKQKKILMLLESHDKKAYKRAISLVGDLNSNEDDSELQGKLNKTTQNWKKALTDLLEEQRKNQQLTKELTMLKNRFVKK